jgi:hypothetical protein
MEIATLWPMFAVQLALEQVAVVKVELLTVRFEQPVTGLPFISKDKLKLGVEVPWVE